jgi:hypothetical protein
LSLHWVTSSRGQCRDREEFLDDVFQALARATPTQRVEHTHAQLRNESFHSTLASEYGKFACSVGNTDPWQDPPADFQGNFPLSEFFKRSVREEA